MLGEGEWGCLSLCPSAATPQRRPHCGLAHLEFAGKSRAPAAFAAVAEPPTPGRLVPQSQVPTRPSYSPPLAPLLEMGAPAMVGVLPLLVAQA